MHSVLVRTFAYHPLVEACYVDLLAPHPHLHLVSGFEPAETQPSVVGIFDHQPSALHAVLMLSHRKFPAMRSVLLLPPCDEHASLSWLRCGVSGIVPYGRHKQDLYKAIQHVANGQLWFPASVLRQSLRSESTSTGNDRASNLTSREREVITLVLLMRSNKEIADELRITERTAKFHVGNILRKTEVKSRQTLLALHSLERTA